MGVSFVEGGVGGELIGVLFVGLVAGFWVVLT